MEWTIVGPIPPLTRDEVHVWRAELGLPPSTHAALEATLAPDELARASRFHFARDRRRFVAGRGILRQILSAYARCRPSELCFSLGPHGKPSLDGSTLRFNLAHSADVALVALSLGREVGVDLERIDATRAADDIAERFFSAGERAALAALTGEQRVHAFFRCWTRKEAYLKAIGRGLSLPLDSFTVPVGEEDISSEVNGFLVRGLDPGTGFAGALAAEEGDWRLSGWDWRPPVAPPGGTGGGRR